MGNKALSHVTVFKDEAGEWRFRAVAPNGEPVAVSEGYHNRLDAISEAEKLWRDVDVFVEDEPE